MVKLPSRISLANLPTRIEKLDRLSKELGGPQIYIKRDDQTGSEISGNKIRKLEYVIKEALEQKCDYLITCGGIQSNHARATAAAAAKLGLGASLVLRSGGDDPLEGNYLLDRLFGAEIRFITPEDYRERRMEIMEEVKDRLVQQGYTPYIIPEGASNGIGTFGYYTAMEEILEQERQMGVAFDAIGLAVGSGGTYSGMFLANKMLGHRTKILGINVCDTADYFRDRISNILNDSLRHIDKKLDYSKNEIEIIDGYVGKGYAQSTREELAFIHWFAKLEGIILDPVYTGKGMYGLVNEIRKGNMQAYNNILYIHTGGLFGLFPKKDLFFNEG
ncbi:MAG: pyridoxal phosphate-dependent enzyme D-cysteine desulfhydrase family [Anaerosolibacter sp.]|uniref:D-cysteine desulfhydrase family protein n=1 Tax=Anaerosolibacter sp. TaxID=1872527 RepID=UPI0026370A63|nr:D-cysteine desulfhydrase family protein [Anaerosolibacter sp.]MDF2546804.1 pyridoxal phosphate-dependent enzyme D-cysteine desulfhydrase family [Anaerosolibacter sp.]